MVFVRRCLVLAASLGAAEVSATCPDDPEIDLCDDTDESQASDGMRSTPFAMLLPAVLGGSKIQTMVLLPLVSMQVASAADTSKDSTCGHIKAAYKDSACCGSPEKGAKMQIVPMPATGLFYGKTNPCSGKKPTGNAGGVDWDNWACTAEGVVRASEQSGADVTVGYSGNIDTSLAIGLGKAGREPITSAYRSNSFGGGSLHMCPVNVHWHWGAEHRSEGEYDETFDDKGPAVEASERTPRDDRRLDAAPRDYRRLGSAPVTLGLRCKHYNAEEAKFTTEYDWKHCTDMKVGETYEVHWPHSAAGLCGSPWQFQSPFYDGVFCNDDAVGLVLNGTIEVQDAVGVQGQVFVIVNDETYYYPNLINGWIKDGDYAKDVTYYTGSTTGTSRGQETCSRYAPITWQVDRKCHLISASSFDKMCADMKAQPADMSSDLHPHGARAVVKDDLAPDNYVFTPP